MMLSRNIYFSLVIGAGLGFAGCEVADTLSIDTAVSDFMQEFADSTKTIGFEIRQAQLNLTELRFEAEIPEDHEVEIRIEHDHGVAVDLLQSALDPDLITDIPTGPFEELEVRLKAESVKGAPTLEVQGLLTDSMGTSIPFILQIHHEFELRLEIENEYEPFYFHQDFLGQFKVGEKLSRIFQEVNSHLWSTAETDEQGVILISLYHNQAIFQEISFQLGDDFKIKIELD